MSAKKRYLFRVLELLDLLNYETIEKVKKMKLFIH
mgnify:CR=1 FL=1|jgi:hypothetical protein